MDFRSIYSFGDTASTLKETQSCAELCRAVHGCDVMVECSRSIAIEEYSQCSENGTLISVIASFRFFLAHDWTLDVLEK